MRARVKLGAAARTVGHFGVLGAFGFFAAMPFYLMLVMSLKQSGDLLTRENNPFILNAPATLENVRILFEDTLYGRWLANTALVGVLVVLITLVLAVPAGYALARLTGYWGERLGIGIFLTYLVPPTLLFIPLSRVISNLGLQDSLWSLVLIYPSFTIPFATWLMMGFFKTIPRDLEEAAMVDGASRLKAIYRIVLPISLPGILTVVIFAFSLCVNEFIYAFTFISSSEQRTVSAGIPNDLIRGDVFFWQSLMAATLIPAIPLALLYNAFLDRFIKG